MRRENCLTVATTLDGLRLRSRSSSHSSQRSRSVCGWAKGNGSTLSDVKGEPNGCGIGAGDGAGATNGSGAGRSIGDISGAGLPAGRGCGHGKMRRIGHG